MVTTYQPVGKVIYPSIPEQAPEIDIDIAMKVEWLSIYFPKRFRH